MHLHHYQPTISDLHHREHLFGLPLLLAEVEGVFPDKSSSSCGNNQVLDGLIFHRFDREHELRWKDLIWYVEVAIAAAYFCY
jgi:hypothetical protein